MRHASCLGQQRPRHLSHPTCSLDSGWAAALWVQPSCHHCVDQPQTYLEPLVASAASVLCQVVDCATATAFTHAAARSVCRAAARSHQQVLASMQTQHVADQLHTLWRARSILLGQAWTECPQPCAPSPPGVHRVICPAITLMAISNLSHHNSKMRVQTLGRNSHTVADNVAGQTTSPAGDDQVQHTHEPWKQPARQPS